MGLPPQPRRLVPTGWLPASSRYIYCSSPSHELRLQQALRYSPPARSLPLLRKCVLPGEGRGGGLAGWASEGAGGLQPRCATR